MNFSSNRYRAAILVGMETMLVMYMVGITSTGRTGRQPALLIHPTRAVSPWSGPSRPTCLLLDLAFWNGKALGGEGIDWIKFVTVFVW